VAQLKAWQILSSTTAVR